jgi:hypothetical protein
MANIEELIQSLEVALVRAVKMAETCESVTVALELIDDDGKARGYWAVLPTMEYVVRQEAHDWIHASRWVSPEYVITKSKRDGFRPTNHI